MGISWLVLRLWNRVKDRFFLLALEIWGKRAQRYGGIGDAANLFCFLFEVF